jgi:hypothetical protein
VQGLLLVLKLVEAVLGLLVGVELAGVVPAAKALQLRRLSTRVSSAFLVTVRKALIGSLEAVRIYALTN